MFLLRGDSLNNGRKYIFAAGGTGGHINPALAVASLLKTRDSGAEILFIGTADKLEAKLVPEAGFDFKTIDISGFKRSFSPEDIISNLKTAAKLLKSSSQAKKIIRDFNPDVVIGFGGYVSGPVLRTASKLNIKTAIHEQNSYPGVANKALAKNADAVMISSEDAKKYIKSKAECVLTGLPIRNEIINADRVLSRFELELDDRAMIFSSGGSLGSKTINNAITGVITESVKKKKNYYFHHSTGLNGSYVKENLIKNGIDSDRIKEIIIREYVDDMHRCLAAADLIISRAGANSINEIEALGKPSILIPYPFASENHQYYNAMTLVNCGAAVLIEDKDLTAERLEAEIDNLINNKDKLKEMGENAKKLAVLNAAENICNVIEKL